MFPFFLNLHYILFTLLFPHVEYIKINFLISRVKTSIPVNTIPLYPCQYIPCSGSNTPLTARVFLQQCEECVYSREEWSGASTSSVTAALTVFTSHASSSWRCRSYPPVSLRTSWMSSWRGEVVVCLRRMYNIDTFWTVLIYLWIMFNSYLLICLKRMFNIFVIKGS